MSSSYDHLLVEKQGNILIVKFNHPLKKNAIATQTYKDLTKILEDAGKDDSIMVLVLTGVGDYYSSGNDIGRALERANNSTEDPEKAMKENNETLVNFIRAFFTFPKILIAVVNGPAIGIAATTAALCDVIYCSDKAYFLTPFTKFGLAPEGCSSYTFPRILGNSKATEMLLLNHKLTAKEALNFNFVSEVYKAEEFNTKIWPKIVEYSKLQPGTLRRCKALMKKFDLDKLEEHMQAEMESLAQAFQSSDFYTAALGFMSRKSKL